MIGNQRVSKAATAPRYRPRHAPLDPGNSAAVMHRWKYYLKLAKPCKNRPYGGSVEVPGLRRARNTLHRRMKEKRSGHRSHDRGLVRGRDRELGRR